ncbi:MAG: hypothetical protein HKN44_07220 [Ilumatobacter sp.]|nr:hypothetical protein [Ilumatobacter sp.]
MGRTLLVAAISMVAGGTACDGRLLGETTPTTVSAGGAVEANATVDFVIDGDTIDVVIDGREERVRLIGIDTPETKRPDAPIECYGPEATAFMQELLPVGTPVRIERDIVNRDDYGRLLGYVYRAADGIFVNYEMMRQGYAQTLSIGPNDLYAQLFADAAGAAERDDAGLWGRCSG